MVPQIVGDLSAERIFQEAARELVHFGVAVNVERVQHGPRIPADALAGCLRNHRVSLRLGAGFHPKHPGSHSPNDVARPLGVGLEKLSIFSFKVLVGQEGVSPESLFLIRLGFCVRHKVSVEGFSLTPAASSACW